MGVGVLLASPVCSMSGPGKLLKRGAHQRNSETTLGPPPWTLIHTGDHFPDCASLGAPSLKSNNPNCNLQPFPVSASTFFRTCVNMVWKTPSWWEEEVHITTLHHPRETPSTERTSVDMTSLYGSFPSEISNVASSSLCGAKHRFHSHTLRV